MLKLRVDRWLALYCFRPLRRAFASAGRYRIPILMYHSISEDPEPGVASYYRLCTSPKVFRQQMTCLHEKGYQTVDLDDLDPVTAAAKAQNGRLVAITFDDGFRDNFTEALPVLEEFGFTATVYVATAYIRERRRSFKGRHCLTWREVREMRRRGIRFGSHTVSHPVLHDLPWRDIESEIQDSKNVLEERIQTSVTSFAHPYAFPQEDHSYVARLRQTLQATGYRDCMTTIIGRADPRNDRYALPRLPVNSDDDVMLFKAKLEGAYDWLAAPQSVMKLLNRVRRNGALRAINKSA